MFKCNEHTKNAIRIQPYDASSKAQCIMQWSRLTQNWR